MKLLQRIGRRARAALGGVERGLPWRWRLRAFADATSHEKRIVYLGPNELARDAAAIFFSDAQSVTRQIGKAAPLVVAMPFATRGNWLNVPSHLRCMIELDRGLDDVLDGWDGELRRKVRRLVGAQHQVQLVKERSRIEELYHQFFVPYADHRHGEKVHHYLLNDFIDFAERGELTQVLDDGEPIAAELGLGYAHGRDQQRVWACLRMGFPRDVFVDPRRLSDANIISHFLHLERAVQRSYWGYDLGLAEARPGSGLLEFKRRRRATMFVPKEVPRFWVHVAPEERAAFLAHSPVFSLDAGDLWLNLGVTEQDTDEQILNRYGSFYFRGIKGVRLHSERTLSPALHDRLERTFAVPIQRQIAP